MLIVYQNLTLLGKIVIPWIVRQRNNLVLRYIESAESLLDIGCGQGYLLARSPCYRNIGIDEFRYLKYIKDRQGKVIESSMEQGKRIEKELPFDGDSFDYVTMIAVIEHLPYPDEIIQECHRVLKTDGLLIVTTPLSILEKVLPFLDKGSELFSYNRPKDVHLAYYGLNEMNRLTMGLFSLLMYKRFQLGVNQLFVYKKNRHESAAHKRE